MSINIMYVWIDPKDQVIHYLEIKLYRNYNKNKQMMMMMIIIIIKNYKL